MMKFSKSIIIFLLLFSSCSEDDDNLTYPNCIEQTIDNYYINYPEPRTKPAEISKYLYHDQEVYIFDPGSGFYDFLYTAVDNNCISICEFGGIAGVQTCKDWDSDAKFIEIVWKDNR